MNKLLSVEEAENLREKEKLKDELEEMRQQRNIFASFFVILVVICIMLLIQESGLSLRYVGSITSDKYHRESCVYVDKIYGPYRVYYYSRAEAEAAGREPCALCLPEGRK